MSVLPKTPWSIKNEALLELGIVRDWTPSEWQSFQSLVDSFVRYGKAAQLNDEFFDLIPQVQVFPIPWGTLLDVSEFSNGEFNLIAIGAANRFVDIGPTLKETYGLDHTRIPQVASGYFKVLQGEIYAQSFGFYARFGEENQGIVILDPMTLHYPYLGPSNYGHELAHHLSREEEIPRFVERRVLEGALLVEPEPEHKLINVMLEYLDLRESTS